MIGPVIQDIIRSVIQDVVGMSLVGDFLIWNGVLNEEVSFIRSGSVTYDGEVFLADTYISKDGLAISCGARTNVMPRSKQLDLAPWVIEGTASVAADGQTISVDGPGNDIYLIADGLPALAPINTSIIISSEASETGVLLANNSRGAQVGQWEIDLSLVGVDPEYITPGHPALTEIAPFTTNATGQTGVIFRAKTGSVTAKLHHVGQQLSKYSLLPFYIPTEASAVSIDTSAASLVPGNTHGMTVDLTKDGFKWLLELMDTAGSGILRYVGLDIIPPLAQWQTSGDLDLIVADDGVTVEKVFYVDDADGKYKLTDGTNTAVSSSAYIAGQVHSIDIYLNEDEMWLRMDGVDGTKVSFTGTLINGAQTLKFSAHEDIIRVKHIIKG